VAYFNYSTHLPADWWARRSFLHTWWQLNTDDARWLPPDYTHLRRLVMRTDTPYWARIGAQPLYLAALPQRRQAAHALGGQPTLAGAVFEAPVAATVLLCEPEHAATAYLGLLHCANDEETLTRLLDAALTHAAALGCTRLVGPSGPTPAWGGGALCDSFDRLPPLHTPYHPPYLADLLATNMEPCRTQVLLTLPISGASAPATSPATLTPLSLSDLAAHPALLEAALSPHSDAPSLAPDAARLVLDWVGVYPVMGWLAQVDATPVGFVVVQPDLAPLVRQSGGGRWPPWRWYAKWAQHRPAARGRLLFGAVAPAWRGRGIGWQLLGQILRFAAAVGWAELICGPFVASSAAVTLLQRAGAQVNQHYTLFEWNG